MIYDASGCALRRSAGYVRQWVKCETGAYADAIGERILEPEKQLMEDTPMTMCTACSHEDSVRRKPTPKGKQAERKVAKVMGEYKEGTLKSSSGETVTSRPQAIAISLSEARRAKKK